LLGTREDTKYSPGKGPTDPSAEPKSTQDDFPICNPHLLEEEVLHIPMDKTNCQDRPCTCHHVDYTLWSIKQWGEDCSYQYWAPRCDTSGMYSAVQHKHSISQEKAAYRWCSSPEGERIYGKELFNEEESQMTCACSLKKWELQQEKVWTDVVTDEEINIKGRDDVTLHCTELGNYEKLQCDNGLCWCVEERSGDVISMVVPENVVVVLPCHPSSANAPSQFGSQYLRKCENRAVGIAKTRQILSEHGSSWTPSREYECDDDGGFAPVQCDDENCNCWTNNGQIIAPYGVEADQRGTMTCSCARDKNQNIDTGRTCAGNGDYKPLQFEANQEFCADPLDGWRISGRVPKDTSQLPCCLDSEWYGGLDRPEGHYYNTGKYVTWDTTRSPSYKCRGYNGDDEQPNCRSCQEDIMKCDS